MYSILKCFLPLSIRRCVIVATWPEDGRSAANTFEEEDVAEKEILVGGRKITFVNENVCKLRLR